MKPENHNKPLLLADGAPVRCSFMARADAPVFWEECEQDATHQAEVDELDDWNAWVQASPNAVIALRPGRIYFCDSHRKFIEEVTGGWADK